MSSTSLLINKMSYLSENNWRTVYSWKDFVGLRFPKSAMFYSVQFIVFICIVKHDSDRRIQYDCESKIYSIIMCDYFNALFYLLRVGAVFCCAAAALIRERCLSKSLFYECSVSLMHYSSCNAEPTIIRRVIRDSAK